MILPSESVVSITRKRYLEVSKKKKVTTKQMHNAVGQQLRYLARNFKHIEKLRALNQENLLTERHQYEQSVIKTLYEQQKKIHKDKSHSVKDRIVIISKPYVGPMVRGKVKSPTNFGAKINISLVDDYAFIENLS